MKQNNSGFTLVELLAVITILAILIGIASGSVISVLNRSKKNMAREMRSNLSEAALTHVMDHAYLEKCSVEFSKEIYEDKNITNLNNNTSCFRRLTVSDLVSAGVFENNRNACDDEDIVIVYRYNDGVNSEYKTYISEETCTN